ncbi:type II toxin-antitoxin system VapC family toxin [Desulfonatronovibrio magnus]|uniref:type II toxin-antitoxin system VapC family toxin n=1 Tax=Desulfonatronovibrio magnus TaxID=698827 RepID=UPI0005EAF057|nr:PIN domain-containing protein [Desulfonatronovibrio magnus]
MILVDTSVWVEIMRDKTGNVVSAFQEKTRDHLVCLSRFNQLELLQGALNEKEWGLLEDYLSTQYFLETTTKTWREAARIYFELRTQGITVRSPIDCCIAQLAIENKTLLLHRDRDFEMICKVRMLNQERFEFP